MIRVYGYYSCGGYKDMYLGNDTDTSEISYYLPLLPVMKRRMSEDDIKKLPELEALHKIELLSQGVYWGFPNECSVLFSHGGYLALYETLASGQAAFAVSDIPSKERDEEDRSIPFSLMFLADGSHSIDLLDRVVSSFCSDAKPWILFFSTLFEYSAQYNGIAFNLRSLFEKFRLTESCDFVFNHIPNRVQLLIVSSAGGEENACRQLGVKPKEVDLLLYGMSKRPPLTGRIRPNPLGEAHSDETTGGRALLQNGKEEVMERRIEELDKKISALVKELHDWRNDKDTQSSSYPRQSSEDAKIDWLVNFQWCTPKFLNKYLVLILTIILLINIIILFK